MRQDDEGCDPSDGFKFNKLITSMNHEGAYAPPAPPRHLSRLRYSGVRGCRGVAEVGHGLLPRSTRQDLIAGDKNPAL
jgi:hypothetical protein